MSTRHFAPTAPDFGNPEFLLRHMQSLMDFYLPQAHDPSGGHYQYFLDDGTIWDHDPRHLVSATRYAVTHSMLWRATGEPRYKDGLAHALRFLADAFCIGPGDGYYWMVEWRDGQRQRVIDDTRQMYGLAFVMLAGAHGLLCGLEQGRILLEDAFATAEQHFWLPEHGLYADDASADWVVSSYRGQNPNMHACEAMLAAFEATHESRYVDRARTLADSVVRKLGDMQGGRICEHYDTRWVPDWLYNLNDSSNIFRPWGYQPGHFTEWAKLLLQLDHFDPQPWHLEKARFLFDEATRTAWDHDNGGFYYGVGPDEQICDANKYHWVQAETLSAAALLAKATGEVSYLQWYERTWGYCWAHFVDHEQGAWFRILDRRNLNHTREKSPAGKVDYHPIGACFDVLRAHQQIGYKAG